MITKVTLKERRARPFWHGHPWVFSGAIERVRGRAKAGDAVEVMDAQGRTIGEGFYNPASQIRVRMVTHADEGPLDDELLVKRLRKAIARRHDLLRLPERTNAYRLVHGEGDGLPGLVVDRLGEWLAIQIGSIAWQSRLTPILDTLLEIFEPTGVLERPLSGTIAEEEGLERPGGLLVGEAPEEGEIVTVTEDGLKLFADPAGGQKTGFYGDQRDNRARFETLAEGKRVLDLFSYVGAFGMRAARGGASSVKMIDSSGPAIALAQRAVDEAGYGDRVVTEEANVLRWLDHAAKRGEQADLVVIDPPKLVHRRGDLRRGLRLYHEINTKALRLVADGGVLVTCSCSQHVQPEAFDEMLVSAAKESRVRTRELWRSGQSPDHPVQLPHDEGRYLDTRWVEVEGIGSRRVRVSDTENEEPGAQTSADPTPSVEDSQEGPSQG